MSIFHFTAKAKVGDKTQVHECKPGVKQMKTRSKALARANTQTCL